jgi:hypothetical protein
MTCEAPGFNFISGWRSPVATDSGARPPISPLWGPAEKRGEVLDPLHIVMLGFRRDVRIVMSSIMLGATVGMVVETPQSQGRAPDPAIAFPVPPAAAPYRASGLVL